LLKKVRLYSRKILLCVLLGYQTIGIRVFLPSQCLSTKHKNRQLYTRFLGTWFNIFPFTLQDLTGPLQAKKLDLTGSYRLAVPPFKVSRKKNQELFDAAEKRMENAIERHNVSAEQSSSQLSLTSSMGDKTRGGVATSDTTMQSVFQNYYREKITEHLCLNKKDLRGWLELEKGVLSNHRTARAGRFTTAATLDSILHFEDRILTCNFEEARALNASLNHSSNLMENLENLGHAMEAVCEGLTCELLPFQKQSLKWALERERVAAGIQSYFWVKVPVQIEASTTDIYYSPILGLFRKDKPQVVRGGIIAEEMGLGKTIISLALILKNPAPPFPISGSPSTSLENPPEPTDQATSHWNTELQVLTSGRWKRRGSILSRGTLVICPVSLVGQWIEEAKSKLKEPGLVYPYHGQNRKRNARGLAKNAIVVTTYEVLASDNTYHRAKSDDPNYCPPMEQVRWWRIICDEGHCLRQSNTKRYSSISSLAADHKWIVSGTPINTSVLDLKSQLSFLGIENVQSLFNMFCNTRNYAYSSEGDIGSPAELLFFLRNIMMRHAQKQTYRGTYTTLMSLPAKAERSIEVDLSAEEKNEYDKLNNDAKSFYVDFKAAHGERLSSHYLKLSQKLTPMRVACSGGFIPLNDAAVDEDQEEYDNEGDDAPHKKKITYSDFAFTSKFKMLLSELERIRDEDPTSKSLVFSQYTSTLTWLKEELPKHGFQFRTLSGDMSMKQRAMALHDFQSDPPTTIFLLSMR
jgi:SNF2 family DNA or RNA helicase